MTRDEGTSAWYRKKGQTAPAVTVTRKAHTALSGRQPKFVTKDGLSVQAMALDGVAQYQIMRGPYLVARVGTITEVAQYVDLSQLEEVRS